MQPPSSGPLQYVIAFIQLFQLDAAVDALRGLPSFPGMSVSEVQAEIVARLNGEYGFGSEASDAYLLAHLKPAPAKALAPAEAERLSRYRGMTATGSALRPISGIASNKSFLPGRSGDSFWNEFDRAMSVSRSATTPGNVCGARRA